MKTLCSCPRVVRMFGYCDMVEEQQLALLMQLAHGGTVANLLEDKSVVLTDLQKGIIIHQSAMGMEYLIEHGVLHRDLKSFNLLMDKEGNIMVSYVCFTAESLHSTYRVALQIRPFLIHSYIAIKRCQILGSARRPAPKPTPRRLLTQTPIVRRARRRGWHRKVSAALARTWA